jgi:hypothetical protein
MTIQNNAGKEEAVADVPMDWIVAAEGSLNSSFDPAIFDLTDEDLAKENLTLSAEDSPNGLPVPMDWIVAAEDSLNSSFDPAIFDLTDEDLEKDKLELTAAGSFNGSPRFFTLAPVTKKDLDSVRAAEQVAHDHAYVTINRTR